MSAFCSVSLEPPLVLVSVDERSEAHAGFEAGRLFAVSLLSEGQEDVSRLFARPGPDKFAQLPMAAGPHGLDAAPGAYRGTGRAGHSRKLSPRDDRR